MEERERRRTLPKGKQKQLFQMMSQKILRKSMKENRNDVDICRDSFSGILKGLGGGRRNSFNDAAA